MRDDACDWAERYACEKRRSCCPEPPRLWAATQLATGWFGSSTEGVLGTEGVSEYTSGGLEPAEPLLTLHNIAMARALDYHCLMGDTGAT